MILYSSVSESAQRKLKPPFERVYWTTSVRLCVCVEVAEFKLNVAVTVTVYVPAGVPALPPPPPPPLPDPPQLGNISAEHKTTRSIAISRTCPATRNRLRETNRI